MTRKRIISSVIPELARPETLDRYLAGRFTYFTLDQWRREIGDGKLALEGIAVTDSAAMLWGGETLSYDGRSIIEPDVDQNIAILYEDDGFIAVNKTGNLPVHPSGRYFNHTLTAILEMRLGRKV